MPRFLATTTSSPRSKKRYQRLVAHLYELQQFHPTSPSPASLSSHPKFRVRCWLALFSTGNNTANKVPARRHKLQLLPINTTLLEGSRRVTSPHHNVSHSSRLESLRHLQHREVRTNFSFTTHQSSVFLSSGRQTISVSALLVSACPFAHCLSVCLSLFVSSKPVRASVCLFAFLNVKKELWRLPSAVFSSIVSLCLAISLARCSP